MKRLLNAAAIALPIIIALPVPTLAAEPVTECGAYLNEPGKYRLAHDLLSCPGPGVIIASSGISLNLRGHTITCAADVGPTNLGILASEVSNIVIRNGRVSNCAAGIVLSDVRNATVRKMKLHDNAKNPLLGTAGLLAFGLADSTIMNNEASDNARGIFLTGSPSSHNNLIKGNVTDTNQASGITVIGDNNRIVCNSANDNTVGGISVGSPATGNLIRGNSTIGNLGVGINLYAITRSGQPIPPLPSGNTVKKNISLSNATGDVGEVFFDFDNFEIVSPDQCGGNTWKKNRFVSEFGPGCAGVSVELDDDDVCGADDDEDDEDDDD